MEKTDYFPKKPGFRQLWTKALGTVMQYSYIFLSFSGSLIKHCVLFEIFFQFSLPLLYTRKIFWIHASNIVCGVRGGVRPV